MPHVQNGQFVPGTFTKAQTTAGTTQADAATQIAGVCFIPTVSAAGAGVIMKAAPAQTWGMIVNADQTNGCLVYPPVGASFNGLTANLAINLPPKSSFWYYWIDATTCAANV